jgi:replicative DNA helicase
MVSFQASVMAERDALGVILRVPGRLDEAVTRIVPEDFYERVNRKIFAAMLRLADERRTIDEISLDALLKVDGDYDAAGGFSFLTKLADGVGESAPLAEYCYLIKESARSRHLQRVIEEAGKTVQTKLTEDVLSQLETEISVLREDQINAGRGAVHIAEVVHEVGPMLDRAGSGTGKMLGSPTGYRSLDKVTNGWMSGDFNVLAARPSKGKTSLALEFALHQARQGNAVAFFSLEMSRSSILLRLICRDAGVSYQSVCSGYMNQGDARKLCASIPRVTQLPIWIDDRAAIKSHDLRFRLRAMARRNNIKFCIVDYLQLVVAKAENRVQEITKVSMDLKAAAKELGELTGGTLMATAQLSRAGADGRPQLHHLRDSGQVEQDADVVMLLWDETQSELGRKDPSIKLVEVAKQRNGPCEILRFEWLPIVMGFEDAGPDNGEPHDGKSAGAGR